VTDTLNAVATPWAERANLVRQDGSESPPLVIKAEEANTATSLEIQLVLQNLRRPLQVGDSFPVTFLFDKSGPQRVMVKVKKQAD
jgi:copper(I)-binding protein